MWGKITALVVAFGIGLAVSAGAQAQPSKAGKTILPPVKGTTTTAAGPGSAAPGARSKKGKVATARARPGKARPPQHLRHRRVASHVARSAKPGQMRAAGRAARPGLRGPSRAAVKRPPAQRQAYLAPATRGGTRYGRPPALPKPSGRPAPQLAGPPRTLSFYNVHTGQSLTATYWRSGRYVPAELQRLNYFLRDSRDGDRVQMDPALFDLLWLVRRQLRSTASYHVLSAYRSPETNAWLASVSSGVASDSLHMRGRAMDVRLPDRSPSQIRRAASALRRGGVGYYPSSGFVHIDTGAVRYW